jgi:hypothetical protein
LLAGAAGFGADAAVLVHVTEVGRIGGEHVLDGAGPRASLSAGPAEPGRPPFKPRVHLQLTCLTTNAPGRPVKVGRARCRAGVVSGRRGRRRGPCRGRSSTCSPES